MKTKDKETGNLVKKPETDLISLVASKLKGRVLFPEKVNEAKELF